MISRPLTVFIATFLCSFAAIADTDVSGAVDGDWTLDGSPYVCSSSDLSVSAGHTLTIEPGVVVKFAPSRRMQVAGSLVAIGTSGAPITFTSSTANPAAGAWKQLQFQNSANVSLDYVTVQWAGQGNGVAAVQIGAGSGAGSLQASISHTTVQDCPNFGFRVATDNVLAHNVTITSSSVQRAARGGLDIQSASIIDAVTVTGNDFSGNSGPPVQISTQALPAFNGSAERFAGNLPGDVFSLPIYSSISLDVVLWHDVAVEPGSGGGPIVSPGVRLTVEPGVTMSFDSGQYLDVRGTLVTAGTAARPAAFTGVGATPGSWNGIWLHTGSSGTLDHALVEFAGAPQSASILVDGADLTVTNSDIGDSGNTAIDFENSDLVPHALIVGSSSIHDVASGDPANPANGVRVGFTLPGDSVSVTSNTFAAVDQTISVAPATLPAFNGGPNAVAGNAPNDTIWLDGGAIPTGVTLWAKAAALNDLTVPALALVTLEPGSGLTLGAGAALNVSGTLVVAGAPGGAVVLDGAAGAWSGIQFSPGSTGTITSAVISHAGYAGTANVNVHGAAVSITGSAILGGTGPGISLTGVVDFSMRNSVLRDNRGPALQDTSSGSRVIGNTAADGNDVLLNGDPVDSASNNTQRSEYNFWGSDSGPLNATLNPFGAGGRVSDHIDIIPFSPSPLTLPVARLEPILSGAGGPVVVTGVASSPLLDHWVVEYGLGISPTSFSPISTGTANVQLGVVANWDASALDPTKRYTVRLTVFDVLGRSAKAMVVTKSPYGDISGNGIVDLPDAVLALRFAMHVGTPTASQLVVGDVRPKGTPDGAIGIDDAVAILKTAAGLCARLP